MTRQQLRQLRAQLGNRDREPERIGLYNINQRIRLKFGQDYGLRIRSKPGAFTAVYVVLPKV